MVLQQPIAALEEALVVPIRGIAVLCNQKVGFSGNGPFGSRSSCYIMNCGGQGSETTKAELHLAPEPSLHPQLY